MGWCAMKLTIPEQHQLRVALATIKMPRPMADILGGPSIEEAYAIIERLREKEHEQ